MRLRSVDSVLSEFDALERQLGQRSVWFQDETFGVDKHWADEFLDKLSARNQRKGYVWGWGGNSRANLADLDRYTRMKASGCYGVSFGVESGDEVIVWGWGGNSRANLAGFGPLHQNEGVRMLWR